jgi:hypothetical protein
VAYGFDADLLTVWLDALVAVQGLRFGVLCRRHADAMIVPLGWMLDDRREPTLRLFKTKPTEPEQPKPKRARRARGRDDTEQLMLVPVEVVEPAAAPPATEAEPSAEPAWVPVFDESDDLSGLLRARGRLLSRAFNGAPSSDS